MKKQSPPFIPPQQDVISLAEGIRRTSNWRKAIKHLYNDESKVPHAIFIPLEDIYELAKLPALISPEFHVVGVRAYFSIKDWNPDQPIEEGNQLAALLVPVYQVNSRHAGCEGKYDYNDQYPTHDLIVQVPSANPTTNIDTAEDTYSIYDITQPCPNLCDHSSELYGPPLL
jgi:hypothetical protein